VLVGAVLCSCRSTLPPYGQTIVLVDTDLAAPRFAGALRVDLYDEGGNWYESQDVVRANADDWPASFTVYSQDDSHDANVLVRLRVFPEGRTRPYRGERFVPRVAFSQVKAPTSVEELCAAPPSLTLGTTRTLRRGSLAFLPPLTGGNCMNIAPQAGAVAATFDVTEPGTYRMGITSTRPGSLETALELRTVCDDPTTVVDCNSSLGSTSPPPLPSLTRKLNPGRYYLVSGGQEQGAADLEIGVALASDWPKLVRGGAPDMVVDDEPRLVDAGQDRTPSLEPIPEVTVDRLVRVRIHPGEVSWTRVVLRGVCAGTQPMLSAAPPHQAVVLSEATTCVDTEAVRVGVPEAHLEPGSPASPPSQQGTFAPVPPCPPAPAGRDAVCIPGGAFLFGDDRLGAPERLAVMPSFWMDRHEMTVGNYRALQSGFHLAFEAPIANDGPFAKATTADDGMNRCTYSDNAASGREDWPLNCVAWVAARFVCRAAGGDLPTEAEWEYAASAAGRSYETKYPWGDDEPQCLGACANQSGCHEAVFGRAKSSVIGGSPVCAKTGYGPLSVGTATNDDGDVVGAVPGLVGLGGNLAEFTLDGFEPFDSPCWRGAGLVDPACLEDDPPERPVRGSDWTDSPLYATVVGRQGFSPTLGYFGAGFRCVYKAPRQ
jgi:formylglycine-generating enzyme required for sulfatase activity